MKKFKYTISIFLKLFFTIKKSTKISFNDENADYIIWAPNFFTANFLLGDNLQKVWFTCYHLLNQSKSATIYTKKNIGIFWNKNIIFFGSYFYNSYSFSNYANSLIFLTENLTLQKNKVFPNSIEVKLWENKSFMHEYFEELAIRTPETKVIKIQDLNSTNLFSYPFLLKEEHSCGSVGIHKISYDRDMINITKDSLFLKNNQKVILQKLLNIRRDLRVIIVGNEIVLFYWRINLLPEWRTTATGHGSRVDFVNFPEKWRDWILENFKKLKIRTGAFDIAWENDDLNSEPYILEVSPFYSPNAKPKNFIYNDNYGIWKKSIKFKNNYQKAVVDLIFKIQLNFVKTYLNN